MLVKYISRKNGLQMSRYPRNSTFSRASHPATDHNLNIAGPRLLAQAITITASEHEDPAWLKEARSRKLVPRLDSFTHREVSNDALRRLQTKFLL